VHQALRTVNALTLGTAVQLLDDDRKIP
jgi:hypothetical protein